jgi:hypothetical protein
MKKLLFLLSVAMLVVGGCCNNCNAEDIIKYVPAGVDGIVSVDAARLVKLPHVDDLRKESENFADGWNDFELELKKYGLTKEDLPSRVVVFFKAEAEDQKEAGILALTKITEAELVKLLKGNADKLTYKTEDISGRKAFVVTQKVEESDKVAITYLEDNLVMICDPEKAKEYFASAGKKTNEKLSTLNAKADQKSLAYVLFTQKPKDSPQEAQPNPMGGNPVDKMVSAVVGMDITGKNQKDISLKADLTCVDAASASMMATQLKTFLMIMSMQFGGDPDLNKMFTDAVNIDQKDKIVKLDVSITETLINKLKDFSKAMKKQRQGAMPVAAAVSEKAAK